MSEYQLRSERIPRQLVAFSPDRALRLPGEDVRFLITPAWPLAPDGTCLSGFSDRAVARGASAMA